MTTPAHLEVAARDFPCGFECQPDPSRLVLACRVDLLHVMLAVAPCEDDAVARTRECWSLMRDLAKSTVSARAVAAHFTTALGAR